MHKHRALGREDGSNVSEPVGPTSVSLWAQLQPCGLVRPSGSSLIPAWWAHLCRPEGDTVPERGRWDGGAQAGKPVGLLLRFVAATVSHD